MGFWGFLKEELKRVITASVLYFVGYGLLVVGFFIVLGGYFFFFTGKATLLHILLLIGGIGMLILGFGIVQYTSKVKRL
jgi:hypothetical protein